MNKPKDSKMKICTSCQTGMKTYSMDRRDIFCPYVNMCNGSGCTMFKPIRIDADIPPGGISNADFNEENTNEAN